MGEKRDTARAQANAVADAWVESREQFEQRIAELERELAKQKRINELQSVAVNKWVPCPDHRDKINLGYQEIRCYVCLNEKLERERDELAIRLAIAAKGQDRYLMHNRAQALLAVVEAVRGIKPLLEEWILDWAADIQEGGNPGSSVYIKINALAAALDNLDEGSGKERSSPADSHSAVDQTTPDPRNLRSFHSL